MSDTFENCVKKFCPFAPSDLAGKMREYAAQVALYNAKMDLVSANGEEEILRRHVLDSLCAVPVLAGRILGKADFLAADAGSGAGFPGIPLAAAFPRAKFVLIERMSKRCAFLENCAAVLGLENVAVENREIERCGGGVFDCAVFRAFRPLDVRVARSLFALLRGGGFLAAYKAKVPQDSAEVRVLSALGAECRIFPLDAGFLSGGGETWTRSLLAASMDGSFAEFF